MQTPTLARRLTITALATARPPQGGGAHVPAIDPNGGPRGFRGEQHLGLGGGQVAVAGDYRPYLAPTSGADLDHGTESVSLQLGIDRRAGLYWLLPILIVVVGFTRYGGARMLLSPFYAAAAVCDWFTWPPSSTAWPSKLTVGFVP